MGYAAYIQSVTREVDALKKAEKEEQCRRQQEALAKKIQEQ